MLPDILMQIIVFLVSFILPSYIGLHSSTHGYIEAQRRWLYYLCCLVILNYVVLPFLEPVLLTVFSYLPLAIYYELKLSAFVILVMPRFGLLEKLMEVSESNFENAQEFAIQKCHEAISLVMAKVHCLHETIQTKCHTQ